MTGQLFNSVGLDYVHGHAMSLLGFLAAKTNYVWGNFSANLKYVQWDIFAQIAILCVIIYWLLRLMKGTMATVFLGTVLSVLGVSFMVAHWLNLRILEWLIEKCVLFIPVCIVVLYRDEVRRVINVIATFVNDVLIHKKTRVSYDETTISTLSAEVMEMSSKNIGALIAIEQNLNLSDEIGTGKRIEAKLFSGTKLLQTIFFDKGPLHDGGVVLRNGVVEAAGCVFPLCNNEDIRDRFGLRHQAAFGLSEKTDAIVIVVSEETGGVQVIRNEEVTDIESQEELQRLLKSWLIRKEESESFWRQRRNIFMPRFRLLGRLFSKKDNEAPAPDGEAASGGEPPMAEGNGKDTSGEASE